MSKKCFSHQIEPRTAKLIFSIVSIFTEIDKKIGIYLKKCFSHQIEPHTPTHSFLFYWSIFTEIDEKIVIYVKIVFSSSNWATYSYTNLFCFFEAFL